MSDLKTKLASFFRKRSVQYAIPFLMVMVGGSLGLREFARLRYDFSRVNPIRKEAEKLGIPLRDPSEITLEKQYERMQQTLDIDNWEQVRGPRPWEENFEEEE